MAAMGRIPGTGNMVASIITNPLNGANVDADTDFTIEVRMNNFAPGTFTNPANTYYAAPQDLDGGGNIIGHTHVTVQDTGGDTNPTDPLDATQFVFFKGINTPANGQGLLTADVEGGLPAGNYRLCTMASAANHQPVLMPVAQRGAQDDCVRFTVGGNGGGGGGNNNNNGGGNQDGGDQNGGDQNQDGGDQNGGDQNQGGGDQNGGDQNQGGGDQNGGDQNQGGGDQNGGDQNQGGGDQNGGDQNQGGGDQNGGDQNQDGGDQNQDGGNQDGGNQDGGNGGDGNSENPNNNDGGNNADGDDQTGSEGDSAGSDDSGADSGAGDDATNGGNGGASNGAIGGITAPEVVETGDSDRPFGCNGNSFTTKQAAAQRACDIQNNACSDAVNGGQLNGVSLADCNGQVAACVSELA